VSSTILEKSATTAAAVNIAARLSEMAKLLPAKRAVVFPAGRDRAGRVAYSHLTFQQLDEESDRYAWGFERAGIRRGTKTVLFVRPSLDFFALTFALFKVGAVIVMIDPGLGKKRVLRCLDEIAPEALVAVPIVHAARALTGALPSVETRVTVGRRWFWGGSTLSQIRANEPKPYPRAETRADDTAAILFTSGSTGIPKGAVYTHGTFDAQVRFLKETYAIGPDEVDLPTFPLFALFDAALGMTAVIPDMDPTRPGHVDPRRIFEPIADQGVTHLFGSPALLDRIAPREGDPSRVLSTLRRVISCGAPVPPGVLERMRRILPPGVQVHTPYGATEALPVATIASDEILAETAARTRAGEGTCVGRIVGDLDLEIVRITDDPIPAFSDAFRVKPGEVGEITVAGSVVTAEYAARPEQTRLAKMRDGARIRHRMGDLGRIDEKGRLWFLGRKAHRVETSPGVALFTESCEPILNAHPGVRRSALVGVGARPRQRPAIVLELLGPRGDSAARLAEIRALAARSPVTSSIETFLVYPDAFPVDVRHNAKIDREALARWAAKELGSA
jgi:acyl-CoA synthetase (AMP-forming)/AMP-acid ligase II